MVKKQCRLQVSKIKGKGLKRDADLFGSFLDAVQIPGTRPEEEREVFIAYTNHRVNQLQEDACQKLYKHERNAFAPGELVLAETNLYREKVLLCANQDELLVDRFLDDEVDRVTGVPVVLHHRHDARQVRFTSNYLPPESLKDKAHPYNVELSARLHRAQKLQEESRSGARSFEKDQLRRAAWRAFFEWRDQTVITFRHPFAITSHKSQGSTYRKVFADVGDLGRFSTQALYVAVTRPRELLSVPKL